MENNLYSSDPQDTNDFSFPSTDYSTLAQYLADALNERKKEEDAEADLKKLRKKLKRK